MALLNQMRVGRGGVDAHRLGTVVLVNLAPLDGFEIVAGLLTQNFGTSDCFGFQLIAVMNLPILWIALCSSPLQML